MTGGASDHVVGPFAFKVIISLCHRPASPAASGFCIVLVTNFLSLNCNSQASSDENNKLAEIGPMRISISFIKSSLVFFA
jgi:hypothetical protein